MISLSRRSFLASSVAVAAHPALALPASSGIDVVIVGAGAAGIAAARRIAAAGRKLMLFEASDRVGGRCFTDTRTYHRIALRRASDDDAMGFLRPGGSPFAPPKIKGKRRGAKSRGIASDALMPPLEPREVNSGPFSPQNAGVLNQSFDELDSSLLKNLESRAPSLAEA
jgi:monoamine oxidase